MARYLVGEVDSKLYWHEVDEDATAKLRASGDERPNISVTTTNRQFGTHVYDAIPSDTPHPKFTG